MPKRGSRKAGRRVRSRRRNNAKRRTTKSDSPTLSVHRRLVLYPQTTKSDWLSQLAWFSSVALKLFKLVTGVRDDLTAESSTLGAGTVVIVGPGDFSSHSPFATPIQTTRADKEVHALRAFPFERASLGQVKVKIVPSVDVGSRGGMYAALIIAIDSIDSQTINVEELVAKFSPKYDDIIKHPRAVMSPVDKPINIVGPINCKPHNIRAEWSNIGFINAYPTHALLVAFSDLAASSTEVEGNYNPGKALFEMHLQGQVRFFEPSEVTLKHDSTTASQSCYSCKLLTTATKSINLSFFGNEYEVPVGEELDLNSIPRSEAVQMLEHFGKAHLVEKLIDHDDAGSSFEMAEASQT